MRRVYAPYGFDWRGIDTSEPSTARCTKCDREFPTHHCIRKEGDELVQYFSHLCPGCDSLDHIFGVSSPPERVTLHGPAP